MSMNTVISLKQRSWHIQSTELKALAIYSPKEAGQEF